MKAIVYAAKSTEDSHGSIFTQLADCRTMAEREGWEVAAEFQDEGFSAYSGNRGPGLEAARQAAVEAAPSVLLAQHSDRVARGAGDRPDAAEHLAEVVISLRRSGVTLRTCQDDFFADDRIGLVMAALMGQRNTEDSRRKSEAVKAGKRRAWERGEFPGGPTPDGFEVVSKEPRDVRLDPDRIEVIRLIGDLADEGWGDPSIARELNRRGHRTKAGGAWTRRRIQDLLLNPLYYGGIGWKGEEVNWETDFPSPWNREDLGRRARARSGRDKAKGSERNPTGRPHTNHALAGLAVCGRCVWERGRVEVMRPVTSTYRRKDGSRRRTYLCRHVFDGTGLCDMPAIDAEAVDIGIVNQLDSYLGDFERWREQLLSGYTNERERMRQEVEKARAYLAEQEKICAKRAKLPDVAENEGQMREALRLVQEGNEEQERRRERLRAAESALENVPTEAPADAMLDFYSELGDAVRGRLEGASTMARINDVLKDIFACFIVEDPDFTRPGMPHIDGILVTPMLPDDQGDAHGMPDGLLLADPDERITPPLRTLEVPSAELAHSHA